MPKEVERSNGYIYRTSSMDYPIARAADITINSEQIIDFAEIKIRNIFAAKKPGGIQTPRLLLLEHWMQD